MAVDLNDVQVLSAPTTDEKAHSPSPWKVIEPPGRWVSLNLPELWRYRDLLIMLVWRDISARYRQSIVGYGWAFIKPLVSVLIFAFVFGGLAKLPSDGVPYSLFAMSALIPWTYFSGSLSSISSSVVGSAGLLTKVYFPRLILPLSSLGSGLVDLALQLVLLGGLMAWFGFAPSWHILFLPLFLVYVISATLAFGLWLTALNVRYRDVGQAVPFLLQAWMWLSPVVYSTHLVPSTWQPLFALNPLVGIIDGFRWCLLGTTAPNGIGLAISVVMVGFTLLSGLIYFRHQEATFADII